jgi:hypothetical protein
VKLLVIRRYLRFLDKVLLKNKLHKYFHIILGSKSLNSPLTHNLVVGYNFKNSELHKLFFQYGSDKGSPYDASHPITAWPAHTYADLYLMLFESNRENVLRIFECGIGTNDPSFDSSMGIYGKPGASLFAWRDYFPNATIYAGDLDPKCLFQSERIRTFQFDQLNDRSILELWNKIGEHDFDIIIDDGLHTFEAGTKLFQSSFEKLRCGGVYIIEDVRSQDKKRYLEFFEKNVHRVLFIDLLRPERLLLDNSVIVIWRTEGGV